MPGADHHRCYLCEQMRPAGQPSRAHQRDTVLGTFWAKHVMGDRQQRVDGQRVDVE